jgi:hypothetical protein
MDTPAPQKMNSGILILSDGSPCFVYDEGAHVNRIEMSLKDSILSVVFAENDGTFRWEKLEFPVEARIADMLKRYKLMSVGRIRDGKAEDLHMVPVYFTA